MGGKGASGPQSDNQQIVQMEQQQAAQATAANEQRNARLGYGTNLIQSLFEGTPSGASMIDLSSINNADVPKPTSTGATNPMMAQWLAQNPGYDQSQLTQQGRASLPGRVLVGRPARHGFGNDLRDLRPVGQYRDVLVVALGSRCVQDLHRRRPELEDRRVRRRFLR